jgi:hypothetical protein
MEGCTGHPCKALATNYDWNIKLQIKWYYRGRRILKLYLQAQPFVCGMMLLQDADFVITSDTDILKLLKIYHRARSKQTFENADLSTQETGAIYLDYGKITNNDQLDRNC